LLADFARKNEIHTWFIPGPYHVIRREIYIMLLITKLKLKGKYIL